MEKWTESRVDIALEHFRNGYNCAQSVFVTYADLFGLEEEQATKIASPFGGGLGGMRQVCGTVSGMSLVAGLFNGTSRPADKEGKKIHYDTVRLLSDEFKAEHGSIRCAQLLGLEPGMPEGMKKKPCSEYVRTCASLIEKHLLTKK